MPSSVGKTNEPADASTLAAVTSRPDYARYVGEVVQRVHKATDEAEAVALLQAATERMGGDAAAFGTFVRDDPSHESYRFLLACDPAWCYEYEQRAWYADDPWLHYALNRTEPILASQIELTSPKQRVVVDLAAGYGFRSALIVPAPAGGGVSRVGVLCVGSARDGFFEDDGYIALKLAARSLAMELHDWLINRVKHDLIIEARITSEDLVLLRQERLGNSTKRIAAVLGKSTTAIDSHFQRINSRLGVPNRKAAANLAAEYGLI